MQSKPGNFTQACLTLIGLGLLILAVFLNHYHPHNAGIATAGHGNIYQLNLDVHQVPTVDNDRIAFADDITWHQATPSSSTVAAAAPAVVTAAISSAPTITTPISSDGTTTSQQSDDCAQLDQVQYSEAIKAFAKSRAEYRKAVKASKDNYKPSDSDADNHNSTYYQTYLNALNSAFSNYQLALLKESCQPTQPAPQAFDQ